MCLYYLPLFISYYLPLIYTIYNITTKWRTFHVFFLIYKCVGYWCWWLKIFNNKFHVSNLNILFTIQNNFSITTILMYTLTPELFLSTHPVFNVCGLQFVIFYNWSSVHKHPHSSYPNCCLHFLVCSCVCLSVCLCRFFFRINYQF